MVAGAAVGQAAVADLAVGVPVATGKEIPKWLRTSFQASDFEKIEKAISDLETSTLGEIVPVIVRASTPVWGARLFLICLGGFLALVLDLMISERLGLGLWAQGLFVASGLLIGHGLSKFDFMLRAVIPDADEIIAVHQRAELEFYRNSIHSTQDRTGILILISWLEHRVVVLADDGISAKVPQESWNELVETLVKSIREGHLGEGLTQAIKSQECLLKEHFPRGQSTPRNELSNRVIIRDL